MNVCLTIKKSKQYEKAVLLLHKFKTFFKDYRSSALFKQLQELLVLDDLRYLFEKMLNFNTKKNCSEHEKLRDYQDSKIARNRLLEKIDEMIDQIPSLKSKESIPAPDYKKIASLFDKRFKILYLF